MIILLKGNPKSTSHIYKYTCRGGFVSGYMDKAGKALKEDYFRQAKAAYHGPLLEGKLEVSLYFYHGTKRKVDIDNFNKLVLDALTGVIWEDDSQIEVMHLYKKYDKEDPRIEVRIGEVLTRAPKE